MGKRWSQALLKVHSGRTRGNRHNLGNFIQILESLFIFHLVLTLKILKYWNAVSTDVVQALALAIFKT